MPSERFGHDSFARAPLALAAVAGRQHGLLRTFELRAAGLDSAAIVRWTRAGKLFRKYRGVYTLGHEALSREGEFLAAVFAGGKGAALGHLALAELDRVRKRRASVIDVVVAGTRRSPPGVQFHESRNLSWRDVTTYKGIPVTTFPRLAVDLADVLVDDELANVLHEADHWNLLSVDRVRAAMARANGRHNLDVLERALALLQQGSAGTKSRAERAMRARLGPEWLPNLTIEGFEVDLHVPGSNVIVEVDGSDHRRTRTKADDALRDQVLDAAGYEVIRVTDA